MTGSGESPAPLEPNAAATPKAKDVVSVDVYGIKFDVKPTGPGDEDPDSWADVWKHVKRHLRRIAVSVVGLPADLMGAARSVCQSIPTLPRAIADRLFRGRVLAQAREETKQRQLPAKLESLAKPAGTVSPGLVRLQEQLDLLRAEGYIAELQRHGDGFVLVLVPPEKREQAQVLGHAALNTSTPIAPTLDRIPIEQLDLSNKIRRALTVAGIDYVEGLTLLTPTQVLAISGIGRMALGHIREALARLDVTLSEDEE